jgi:branched-chain amino acid transport system permease protein
MVRWILIGALGALLLGMPFVDAPVANSWLFRLTTLVMLTISWNLMANAGLISLGHSAFWGVGSYIGMLTINTAAVNFLVVLLPVSLGGAVLGVALALVTGRLRGIYFAISTLALAEGVRVIASMLPAVTGGATGLYLDAGVTPSAQLLQFTAGVGAIFSILLSIYLTHTKIHFASRALRNNEDASKMLGIDPREYRAKVVAVSGALAAAAGCFNAIYSGYIDPEIGFSFNYTIMPQISTLIGGIYTVAGPVYGAIVIMILSETTRFAFNGAPGVSLFTLGMILIICVLFLPRGLQGLMETIAGMGAAHSRRGSGAKG